MAKMTYVRQTEYMENVVGVYAEAADKLAKLLASARKEASEPSEMDTMLTSALKDMTTTRDAVDATLQIVRRLAEGADEAIKNRERGEPCGCPGCVLRRSMGV